MCDSGFEYYALLCFNEEPWDDEDYQIMATRDIWKGEKQFEGGKEEKEV
jgi:hypothetical protein